MTAWTMYLFGPPRSRVFAWAIEQLMKRALPVTLRLTAHAQMTPSDRRDPAEAPLHRTFTIDTGHGVEEWSLAS